MKISIITPAFNSGDYIERSILSVINQNYNNYEHIIVDGGSSDSTIDILTKYPHLTWISEKDKGQSDAMNKGFNMATGDIIVYLNADDWFENQVFDYVNNYFETDVETDILVGNLYHRYEDDTAKIVLKIPSFEFKKIVIPFKYNFPYNPVSYFYRRKVQSEIGLFPIDNHYAMDYWFLLRAFGRFNVKKTDLVFGNFFFNGRNKTSVVKVNSTSMAIKFLKEKHLYSLLIKVLFFYFFFQIKQLYRNHAASIIKSLILLIIQFKWHSPTIVKKTGFKKLINKY